jgi:hypothetical protein
MALEQSKLDKAALIAAHAAAAATTVLMVDRVARVDERLITVEKKVDHVVEVIDKSFGPEGFCQIERNKVSGIGLQIKGLWAAIVFLVTTTVTLVVEMIRRPGK